MKLSAFLFVDISGNIPQRTKRGEMCVEEGNIFLSKKICFFNGPVCPKTDVKNPKKRFNFWWAPLAYLKLLKNYAS